MKLAECYRAGSFATLPGAVNNTRKRTESALVVGCPLARKFQFTDTHTPGPVPLPASFSPSVSQTVFPATREQSVSVVQALHVPARHAGALADEQSLLSTHWTHRLLCV